MTRTQLFVTLSLVFGATAPCADGMAAAPQLGPVVPDSWWLGFNDVRAIVAASIDGSTTRIAEWVLAALLAWRYRSLALATLAGGTGRRRRKTSLRTIVGGLPASGVMSGTPPLLRPLQRPLGSAASPDIPVSQAAPGRLTVAGAEGGCASSLTTSGS
ncbi:hypothetical protein LuPra_00422 [Luteitalea pratensis]|uniref:Uncharacterized protein n=1 Tax=Luteitalea pratensis TaxID=1855912 RepID=A0A143PFF9_LUTPR|nr:hypothetical protein [Luteitalea pratensis]AMY07255.1 hypothetical protein LuPra_00422 [Luteitalea pratensis]